MKTKKLKQDKSRFASHNGWASIKHGGSAEGDVDWPRTQHVRAENGFDQATGRGGQSQE